MGKAFHGAQTAQTLLRSYLPIVSVHVRAPRSRRAPDRVPLMPILHILLVEDDARIADLTKSYLERHNMSVSVAADGESGLREASSSEYDLLILDLMLPGPSGLDICRAVRARGDQPIVMLSALDSESDRVLGLELGADDYLVKPFSPRELVARIRTLMRRVHGRQGSVQSQARCGGLFLDPTSHTCSLDGRVIDLTSYEFSLLYALARRVGHVLSRETILIMARGTAEESFDRSVDVRISRIRQKIGDDPRTPRYLKTIRGVGYMLCAPTDS